MKDALDCMRDVVDRTVALSKTTTDDAYKAGQDYAANGANEGNCHFRFFMRPELTAAWEAGGAGRPTP